MAAILKVWRCIKNLNPSIDLLVYLLEENSARFHPNLIWNDRAIGFFEEHRPNSNKNGKNTKTGSDMDQFLIQKLKYIAHKYKVIIYE